MPITVQQKSSVQQGFVKVVPTADTATLMLL
jgi:hypothetical protein